MTNSTRKPHLFAVNDEGHIIPVGHNEPQQFGDVTIDPWTDSVYQTIPGRYYKPSWQYLGHLSEMSIII